MLKSFLVCLDVCVTLRENAVHLSLQIKTIVQFLLQSGTLYIHFKGLKIDEKLTSIDVHCYGRVKGRENEICNIFEKNTFSGHRRRLAFFFRGGGGGSKN